MCFTAPIAGLSAGRAGPSQTPSIATKVTSSPCGNKCAHRRRSIADQREVQQGTMAQVTQGQHTGCIIPLQGKYRSCQWLSESRDLGSLCWLIFGGKSTECGKFKAGKTLMPQTRSLKEEGVKIGQIIKSNPKQVKQGTVLRGPAGLAVFSCGIRLTPLEAVIDGCSLSKAQRNQVLDLVVISGPISKGTSFSRMLLLGPFRTTHSYFDNSVSICPTSVIHYKWTLSRHPSVHAKRKVTIFNCC